MNCALLSIINKYPLILVILITLLIISLLMAIFRKKYKKFSVALLALSLIGIITSFLLNAIFFGYCVIIN